MIFDAIPGNPTGLPPLNVWYPQNDVAFTDALPISYIQSKLAASSAPVCLDIEKYVVTDQASALYASHTLANIVRSVRAVEPGRRVGVYGVWPINGWSPMSVQASSDPSYLSMSKAWCQQCGWFDELIAAVDFICLSLYTDKSGDVYAWSRFAYAMIAKAQEAKKDVFPFLWRYCTDGVTQVSYFNQMIALCKQYAGNAVIWDTTFNAAWWSTVQT
ncbi:MAG: hypothetical protein ACYC9K_00945 [Sulfuricaulis sp.]